MVSDRAWWFSVWKLFWLGRTSQNQPFGALCVIGRPWPWFLFRLITNCSRYWLLWSAKRRLILKMPVWLRCSCTCWTCWGCWAWPGWSAIRCGIVVVDDVSPRRCSLQGKLKWLARLF
ncbi:hypothetical protein BDV19DRAFT_11146 [Aspergillus venezuelensis]